MPNPPRWVPPPAQPTTHMKLPELPEPPTWLGIILSALIGAAFIGLAILLKNFVHSY